MAINSVNFHRFPLPPLFSFINFLYAIRETDIMDFYHYPHLSSFLSINVTTKIWLSSRKLSSNLFCIDINNPLTNLFNWACTCFSVGIPTTSYNSELPFSNSFEVCHRNYHSVPYARMIFDFVLVNILSFNLR